MFPKSITSNILGRKISTVSACYKMCLVESSFSRWLLNISNSNTDLDHSYLQSEYKGKCKITWNPWFSMPNFYWVRACSLTFLATDISCFHSFPGVWNDWTGWHSLHSFCPVSQKSFWGKKNQFSFITLSLRDKWLQSKN